MLKPNTVPQISENIFFDSKERVEERPRPITVSDLEARPGSPSIVVVPGSRSSEEELSPKPGAGTGSCLTLFHKAKLIIPVQLHFVHTLYVYHRLLVSLMIQPYQ